MIYVRVTTVMRDKSFFNVIFINNNKGLQVLCGIQIIPNTSMYLNNTLKTTNELLRQKTRALVK